MTCIAGLVEDDGTVWIGGDSVGSDGWSHTIRRDPKVFKNGEYLIGCTSSFRMIQLLRYAELPAIPTDCPDVYRFMVMTFVEALRTLFREGGYTSKKEDREEGGTFLIGVRGKLYEIGSDFQVAESRDDYGAVGSGDRVALGALYATKGRCPVDRMRAALEAAERHSAHVRGPFVVERLEREGQGAHRGFGNGPEPSKPASPKK